MRPFAFALLIMWSLQSGAQDLESDLAPFKNKDGDRDPAAVTQVSSVRKRNYAGGADEEDLRVQPSLPEASVHVDARGLQREIFKQLYNQDLKEEQQNDMEE